MRKLLKSKILFFLITAAFILSLNLTPLVLQFSHSPEGRTFSLVHNNTQDFFFYQSLMNQGAQGSWLTRDSFTSEPHQSSIIFAYFLWFGKLSSFLNIPYPLMYHLIRILFAFLVLLSAYLLLFIFSVPYPRFTYLLFLLAAPLLRTVNDYGNPRQVEYMSWWTGMDPIRRAAYLPHHMIGAFFLVLSMILILKFVKQQNIKYIIWLSLFAAILAFIHTPSLFIILITLPPALIIYSIVSSLNHEFRDINTPGGDATGGPPSRAHLSEGQGARDGGKERQDPLANDKKRETRKNNSGNENLEFIKNLIRRLANKNYLLLFIYWFIGLLVLLFMVSQTSSGFPWSQYINWEKNLQFPLDQELFGAFGFLLPFALIGLVKAFLSRKFSYILIASWFAIPILFIPFAPQMGISNIRLIQGLPYLPLSILAVFGMIEIGELIQKLINKLKKKILFLSKIKSRNILLSWYVIFTLLFFIFTIPTLNWSIKDQIREFWAIYGNVYFDDRLLETFHYINRNFPDRTITLATFYAGNYIPAFTHTTSFIGHSGYTYNLSQKEPLVRKFFESKMTDEEAKQFLQSNHIDLIFQGPEEMILYQGPLYPDILKPIYNNQAAVLYIPL